jgi:hypothetical protein
VRDGRLHFYDMDAFLDRMDVVWKFYDDYVFGVTLVNQVLIPYLYSLV